MPTTVTYPSPTLRIGIAGYQAARSSFLAAAAGVCSPALDAQYAEAIGSVLSAVATASDACRVECPSAFGAGTPLLRVVVDSAHGIDRIAATVVAASLGGGIGAEPISANWHLQTLLPAPLTLTAEAAWPDYAAGQAADAAALERYAADWQAVIDRSDTVTELPASWRVDDEPGPPLPDLSHLPPFGPVERPGEGYRLSYAVAADFMLRQIDMLVAVWDGKPSRGPGGVADIAAQARALGLPVIVIDAVHPELPPTMLRAVEFEPDRPNVVGWSPQPRDAVLEAADCRDAAIAEAVRAILLPPAAPAAHGLAHGPHPLTLEDFYAEPAQVRSGGGVYGLMVSLLGGAWRAHGDPKIRRSSDSWRGAIDAVADQVGLARDIETVLAPRYARVSALANYYAARYRSAFVMAFLGAALAGAVAVFGSAFSVEGWPKVALIALELAAVFGVFYIVRTGRSRKYHAKYIEYRTLAEGLQSLRFLSTIGEAPASADLQAGPDSWFRWYLRCTARELGLPNRHLDATYQRRILKAVKTFEIDAQIAYHDRNASVMAAVDHAIHRIGNVLFYAVIAALLALLGLYLAKLGGVPGAASLLYAAKPYLSFIAAFLPAAGAALGGIRFMADFDGKAMRSVQMSAMLRVLSARTEQAIVTQDFHETRAILRDLAVTLSDDVSLFRTLYSRRELILPS